MSYLEYTRQAKAIKKFKVVMTAAIRLHPTKPELWLYAARWSLESEADMNGARSYMQRGTRFCSRSKELWIEYAKLEMIYLAKIAIRRKILGLDVDPITEYPEAMDTIEEGPGFDTGADVIAIPDFKDNAIRPSMIESIKVDSEATKDPMTTPALNGAIPLAIFDAARKQPFFDASAAGDFFDMFATFTQVRALSNILQHVLDVMTEVEENGPCTCDSFIRQPLIGLDPTAPEFPGALGTALDRLKESLMRTNDRETLVKKTAAWVNAIIEVEGLDPGIRTVLEHTMRKTNT